VPAGFDTGSFSGRAAIASANNTHAANAIAALSPAGRNAADSRPDTMRDHGRTKTLIAIMAMVFVCLIMYEVIFFFRFVFLNGTPYYLCRSKMSTIENRVFAGVSSLFSKE